MATSTRPKRKSMGDENSGVGKEKENSAPAPAPAKKKKKTDDGEKPPKKKQKKSKPAMQEDDGFMFRSRRATRSSLAAQSSQATVAAPSSSELPPAPPDPPKKKVPKKRTTEQPPPVAEEPKKVKGKRGFPLEVDEEMQQQQKEVKVVEKEKKKKPKERVPAAAAAPTSPPSRIPTLQSGGGGGDGTKMVLPVSDTPIIRRNQQMRKGGQGNRRSSVGMRGRRASSLMDTGVIAEPHAEIVHEDFFKHIHDELLEPQRMKQLLSWCGRRALTTSGPSNDKDANARAVARIIQEEVLADVLSNSELSSWFNREDSQPSTVIKKPNPRNLDNMAKVEAVEANLKRLRDEKETWLSLLKPDTQTTLSLSDGLPDVKLLLQPAESEFASSLAKSQDLLGSAKRLVKQHCGEIEFQVDQLIDGIHKLHHYGESADRLAGKILEDAESTLAVREARLRQASGTEALPIQEVLRSLSRMDR